MTVLDVYPMPSDPVEIARVEEGFRRASMMDGCWKSVAVEHYKGFFHADVRWLTDPVASVAMNPFASLAIQQATAYDEAPVVKFADDADPMPDEEALDSIITEECWPLMIEALPRLFALREQVVYTTYIEGRGIVYETIDPHMLQDVVPDPLAPDQIASCKRMRRRHRPGHGMEWTRETWDPKGNKSAGIFIIEARRGAQGDWEDVTGEYAPDAVDAYPRKDLAGDNLMPFIMFHAAMGSRLFDPLRGVEVVGGTLDTSALNTNWMIGMRDGAHPPKYVLNAQLQGAQQTSSGSVSQPYLVMTPNTIAQFTSTQGQNVAFGSWAPSMKPMEYRQSIDGFVREFAIHAGVSPSDLQVTSGQSGYALALTRDGQRKAQRRVEPSLRRSDRLRLALAAKMHNQAAGALELPEDPKAYSIEYQGLPPTHDEVMAENDEANAQREAGILSPVEHYKQHHPDATDADAWTALVVAARQEAALSAIRSPVAKPAPVAAAPPAPAEVEPDDEPDDEDPMNPPDEGNQNQGDTNE